MRTVMIGVLMVTFVLAPVVPGSRAADKLIEPLVVGWERFFKLDWEITERRGQAVVGGYIVNDSPYSVGYIRLLLDALDAGGGVVAQQTNWVAGELTPFSRVYFEIPAEQRIPSYRVRILAFDRIEAALHQAP
jgi:hypothetical protein